MGQQQHFCPGCFALIPANAEICPACGGRIADFSARDYREKLLHALHHPLSEVRMRAIIALGLQVDTEAAKPLLECALRHPVDVVEGLAIVRSLAQIQARDALERIACSHPAHAVAAAACEALKTFSHA